MRTVIRFIGFIYCLALCACQAPPLARTVAYTPSAIPSSRQPTGAEIGFISSPYAPNAGLIDIRALPVGTKARCPFTGRIFIVPPYGASPALAEYGYPATYVGKVVNYRDFSIRLVKREEHHLEGAYIFSTTYQFEVLDARKTKIGSFTFTMSGCYESTLFFNVNRRKYAAEMFYTTARPKMGGALPNGQIVIWDKSTARARNPALIKAWGRKQF